MERKQFSLEEYKQMIAREREERSKKKADEGAAAAAASSDGGKGLDERPHHTDTPEMDNVS